MGFFKKLFEKKVCDLCGGEIGLLGNRKLEDGNCCKDCASKLSRWFDDRRHSTVAQIRDQLDARAANEVALKTFKATKVIGEENLVYVDENTRRFFVARHEDYLSENPDILTFDQILSCQLDIDEDREEIMREVTDQEGNTKKVSYAPRRYLHRYDFYMEIRVRDTFFDDMRFRLNDTALELESGGRNSLVNFSAPGIDPTRDIDYRKFVSMGEEIVQILTAAPQAAVDPVQTLIEQIRNAPDMETATRAVQAIATLTATMTNKDELMAQTAIAMAETQLRLAKGAASAAPVATPAQEAAKPKFCPNCGAPFEGGKFCQSCGSKL